MIYIFLRRVVLAIRILWLGSSLLLLWVSPAFSQSCYVTPPAVTSCPNVPVFYQEAARVKPAECDYSAPNITPSQAVPYALNAGFDIANAATIVAIAWAESGLNQYKCRCMEWEGKIWSWDRGILQISNYCHYEVTDDEAFDLASAFSKAHQISGGSDFHEWRARPTNQQLRDARQAVFDALFPQYEVEKRDIILREKVRLKFTFTNSSKKEWTFYVTASLRKPDGAKVNLPTISRTLAPGARESVSWDYSPDTVGDWDVMFSIWLDKEQTTLLGDTKWIKGYIKVYQQLPASRDSDGDGIPDDRDRCPNVPGSPSNNGCPEISLPLPQQPSSISVNVREELNEESCRRQPIDPAADTAIKEKLISNGFYVVATQASISVEGEGFAECIGQSEGLWQARARLEVKVIETATKRVLASEALHAGGVDPNPRVAAKRALQRAGERMGECLVQKLKQGWERPCNPLAKDVGVNPFESRAYIPDWDVKRGLKELVEKALNKRGINVLPPMAADFIVSGTVIDYKVVYEDIGIPILNIFLRSGIAYMSVEPRAFNLETAEIIRADLISDFSSGFEILGFSFGFGPKAVAKKISERIADWVKSRFPPK